MTVRHACSNVLPHFRLRQRVIMAARIDGQDRYITGTIATIARSGTAAPHFWFRVWTDHGVQLATADQLYGATNVAALTPRARGESGVSEVDLEA